MKSDVVQEKKNTLNALSLPAKNTITVALKRLQVIEELIQWAKEMQEDAEMLDEAQSFC
ncbi:hypothetical protein PEC18_09195 [Paucibacter sp. O1-1]|nr:hypothetical protein [Paucibacter sp. O1-1]MDA3826027.1 hypothetical protein [Paucibacter sp. O1-1]